MQALADDHSALELVLMGCHAWVVRLVCRMLRDSRAPDARNTVASTLESPERLELAFALGLPRDERVCRVAAARGDLEMLRVAHAGGCALECQRARSKWGCLICEDAARGGHRHVLEWLKTHGCAWDARTCTAAARGAHVGLLRWLRSEECDWNETTPTALASAGCIEALEWAIRDHCAHSPRDIVRAAAAAGQLDLLRWYRLNYRIFCNVAADPAILEHAARGGHTEVMEWACSLGCKLTPWVCLAAVCTGQLGALKWARSNGCEWNRQKCRAFADLGWSEVAAWMDSAEGKM